MGVNCIYTRWIKNQWWDINGKENRRNSQQDSMNVDRSSKQVSSIEEAYKAQYPKGAQDKHVTRGNYVYVKENQQADSLGPYRVVLIL